MAYDIKDKVRFALEITFAAIALLTAFYNIAIVGERLKLELTYTKKQVEQLTQANNTIAEKFNTHLQDTERGFSELYNLQRRIEEIEKRMNRIQRIQ